MAVAAASASALRPSAGQMMALAEAQYRSLFHFYSRGNKVGAAIAGLMSIAWYGVITLGAVVAGIFCSNSVPASAGFRAGLDAGALFLVIYWQFVPLMLVSSGAGLDLRRLVIYPLSRAQLFVLDLLLRVTSGVEALIILTGVGVGLAANHRLGWWTPLAVVPFALFNLALGSALRGVFGRWMAGRRTREIAMLGLIAIATLPQILLTSDRLRGFGAEDGWASLSWAPWALTAEWASGRAAVLPSIMMLAWTAAAFAFAWWQLGRTLRLDGPEQATALAAPSSRAVRWPDWLAALVGDPVATLLEKELRSLSRTPRFRVVFIMGFSFSLMIWLPMMSRGGQGGPPSTFLTLMMGYALLLLGESCFWNTLGFDRAAAQFYFLAPVPFTTVLKAKNLAASIAVTAELLAITTVALVLRLPLTPRRFAEALAATAVTTLLLLAAGNLGSVYSPRATDPSDVWRKASAGRTQALVMFASPVLASPVVLAHLARYAFDSEWAFWGVMTVMGCVACIAYAVALSSAAEAATERRETITGILSAGGGPVAG